MLVQRSPHTFHIPVMGTGYTIDTPVKVAHFGIASVISLADHKLIEQMYLHHAIQQDLSYEKIPQNDPERRAKVITAYLNLMHQIVERNLQKVKASAFEPGSLITRYFEMLPFDAPLRQEYHEVMRTKGPEQQQRQLKLKNKIISGSIDVNIMTKLDKVNYIKKDALPVEYNDAHAAIRGFANSVGSGSVVLSAGLNPRLFSYMAGFPGFFPDVVGHIKKGIILKVSDYRSAMIQGKFLAKKGLWVSEFRIESGLNCGGHAFATDGYLLGPILQEFKDNREQLKEELFDIYTSALAAEGKTVPLIVPAFKITVQGGVGTAAEHSFLIKEYGVDSVGWGTPFLLVPEAVAIDEATLQLLIKAREKDLYLSEISPLGVPFNSIKSNSAEQQRLERIKAGKPGSPCIKEHLVSSKEYSEKPLCTASRNYQKQKVKELAAAGMEESELESAIDKITQKTCLCMGLANAALTAADIPRHKVLNAIAVCPGPNMAYFDKVVSLKEMVEHIYGKINIMRHHDRPHMFVKELELYVSYLRNKIKELPSNATVRDIKYLNDFKDNLLNGIGYYQDLFLHKKLNIRQLMRIKVELSLMEIQQ